MVHHLIQLTFTLKQEFGQSNSFCYNSFRFQCETKSHAISNTFVRKSSTDFLMASTFEYSAIDSRLNVTLTGISGKFNRNESIMKDQIGTFRNWAYMSDTEMSMAPRWQSHPREFGERPCVIPTSSHLCSITIHVRFISLAGVEKSRISDEFTLYCTAPLHSPCWGWDR